MFRKSEQGTGDSGRFVVIRSVMACRALCVRFAKISGMVQWDVTVP